MRRNFLDEVFELYSNPKFLFGVFVIGIVGAAVIIMMA